MIDVWKFITGESSDKGKLHVLEINMVYRFAILIGSVLDCILYSYIWI